MTVSFATDMEVSQNRGNYSQLIRMFVMDFPLWTGTILGYPHFRKHPYLQAIFKIQCRQGTMKWRTFVAVGWTLLAPHSIRFSKNAEASLKSSCPKMWIIRYLHFPSLSTFKVPEIWNPHEPTSTFHIKKAKRLAQRLEVCNGLWHMLSLYAATSHLSGGPVIKTGWSKRSLDSIEAENDPQIGVSSFELAVTDPPNLWESYRTYIYIYIISYTQYIFIYTVYITIELLWIIAIDHQLIDHR
jgi:hypothetical protein